MKKIGGIAVAFVLFVACSGPDIHESVGSSVQALNCAPAYLQSNCNTYVQGTVVSLNSHNWTCSNGNCANCSIYGSCAPGASGCPWGTVWTDNGSCGGGSCTPNCSGKNCGTDGCGGSCGTCSSGQTCSSSGTCTSSSSSCTAPAWSASTQYLGGAEVSKNGNKYRACYWTLGNDPASNSALTCGGQFWQFMGSCSSGTCTPNCSGKNCGNDGCSGNCGTCATGSTCNASGSCVASCTPSCAGKACGSDGCSGSCGTCSGGTSCNASGQCVSSSASGIAGIVSEDQFRNWFPGRNTFYTYQGLTSINDKYPTFANSTDMTIRKREAAAFLANMALETGNLVYVVEQNTGNYCVYCDNTQPYGCPAGQCQYYGRGPIQLSWNFNYNAAGQALGYDLLNNPNLVASNANVAWQTAAWYWNTQQGPGGDGGNCHNAMLNSNSTGGFGETIKHINGTVECPSLNGGNTGSRDSRITNYKFFCDQLGVSYGNNTSC
ncbi:MAG TPA: glycoside hydrolase family 19 protein [Polyangiaceae bacterium]